MVAETRDNIGRSGISVWLKAELPLLMNDPEASMKRLMAIRYPVYATADITVESREVPHEVVVGEVMNALTARLMPKQAADAEMNPGEAT